MKKEMIFVSTIEQLNNKIPEILKKAKDKYLYIDNEFVKKLRKEKHNPVIHLGRYNIFLANKPYLGFTKVRLIRVKAFGKYIKPNKSDIGVFLVLAQ